MTYYRRRDLTDEEGVLAATIGLAVGAAAFYLARIWLQREPLLTGPPGRAELEAVEPQAELEPAEPQAELEPAEPQAELEATADVDVRAGGAERPPR